MINIENISFDHCIKCTVCTVYCPVAKVTHLYPGPKQSGPDAERLRIKNPELVDESLKYCNNCKRCEIACPSDVKIADIIQKAKYHYTSKSFSLRNFLLSRTDLMGSFGTFASPALNYFTKLFFTKFLLKTFLNISPRSFPTYENGTFVRWYYEHARNQNRFSEKVTYFHGCYVNYNNHEIGKTLIRILNLMNIGVMITDEKCCGVPLIANSSINKAKKNAHFNVKYLAKSVSHDKTKKIVLTSSSCAYALKYEYKNLLGVNNSKIYDQIEYITQFIYEKLESNNFILSTLNIIAAYHAPCHLERMGGTIYTIGLLKKIPGLQLKILNSECCGIAGTYGFKNECNQISQDIGKELFKKINFIQPDVVVTDCETCKWQIEMNTSYEVVHPLTLLARAIRFD
ncbi:MAG: anaerobic glycerol-3-phosphate dehydrogenase subunit C [Desulfobacterales bacterium]|nr:anaerobic glycerol-3-phosphate dehydrogenase subunit C [Desulfobacterales bacterium]